AKQIINLLLVSNNFYSVVLYRRYYLKRKRQNYCIQFGHSLWSANELPAQEVNEISKTDNTL
ncbi:unnamed protein product, partial [Heterotrigona itama]